jgi:hypothetical protein
MISTEVEIHLEVYADAKGMTLDEAVELYRRGYVQIGEADGCVVVSEAYAMKQ